MPAEHLPPVDCDVLRPVCLALVSASGSCGFTTPATTGLSDVRSGR